MVKSCTSSTLQIHGMETIVVELLKMLKQRYNYKKLSELTGFPISTLNRYIKDKTIPHVRNLKKLVERISEIIDPVSLIKEIAFKEDGKVIDIYNLMLDPSAIKVISFSVVNEFYGSKLTAIMPLDTYCIPLSTAIAAPTGRKLLILSERPLWDDEDCITFTYKVPGFIEKFNLCLPKKVISSKDSILLLSSFLTTESLVTSTVNTIHKLGASISGLFSVLAEEECWKRLQLPSGSKKRCLLLV